jgi:hypothetical protein
LKNNTVHGINKPWIEKTSTEDLKNSEFGKMLFAFMFWPVKIDPKSLDPNTEVMRF